MEYTQWPPSQGGLGQAVIEQLQGGKRSFCQGFHKTSVCGLFLEQVKRKRKEEIILRGKRTM
jgi:hypothetical protein